MLSKAQSKYIRSLREGSERRQHRALVVEGSKICSEWLISVSIIQLVICTEAWAVANSVLLLRHPECELHTVTPSLMSQLSALSSPPEVLLVAALPEAPAALPTRGWCLALDTIQDPGNLGTMLRIADWFGITDVVCSPGCADAFSPKVLQAAMGAHLRVRVHNAELLLFLSSTHLPVIAAALDGESVYTFAPLPEAVLLIGNESQGLSLALLEAATSKVLIPRGGGAESLNAAVSAGILCALLMAH